MVKKWPISLFSEKLDILDISSHFEAIADNMSQDQTSDDIPGMTQSSLYSTARWRRLRSQQLAKDPLCRFCLDVGRETAATVVDHIEQHKNCLESFYDPDNLQSLCKKCHDNSKQLQEIHGYSQAAGEDGLPIDPKHPWNQKRNDSA